MRWGWMPEMGRDGTPELALSNIGPNVLLKSTAKGPGLPLYKDVAQQSGFPAHICRGTRKLRKRTQGRGRICQ